MTMRVLIAGGGTAGHVNPLLAVARQLEAAGAEVAAIGTATGIEAQLIPAAGLQFLTIDRVPLPRSVSVDLLALPKRLRATVLQARQHILDFKADVVVGFGGYVSAPVYLAARKIHIPIFIHEQNMVPGVANKIGARFACGVGVTFPNTKLRASRGITRVVGLPLRKAIEDLAKNRRSSLAQAQIRRAQAAKILGLDHRLVTLLVTGGSQGAQQLNEAISQAADALLQEDIQVIHLTGKDKISAVQTTLKAHVEAKRLTDVQLSRYQAREYLAEMEQAYALADLVVCRAGAGTVAELAALGIPAVLVPLPFGNGEQAKNGSGLVEVKAAKMVDNKDFVDSWVRANLPVWLANPLELQEAGRAARKTMPVDASKRMADLIFSGQESFESLNMRILSRKSFSKAGKQALGKISKLRFVIRRRTSKNDRDI